MVKKYNFTHYQECLDLLNKEYDYDESNPHIEELQEYAAITDGFDPVGNPPESGEKKAYVLKYIVPILQKYAKDFQANLDIEEKEESVTVTLAARQIIIIKEEDVLKSVLCYATSLLISAQDGGVRLEFYFSTR